ncbi:MAG: acetolactate decarboxylase [Bacteroidales bacterium]|nr:acetolactate decarboxylase [Bacteroidales bacterium]
MKSVFSFRMTAILVLVLIFSACSNDHKKQGTLFQTSTINALLQGDYDGTMTFGQLKKHGNFGLGTVNTLNGEMVGLDGKFYQVRTDGKAYLISDTMKTPFAEVTFFKPDTTVSLDDSIGSFEQLQSYLDKLLPTPNIFYAFRITGRFDDIETRSVPQQHKPYPPLTDVVKNQATFEFHNVEGTMVGFRCPDFVKGINVPGYHVHFITSDRKAGGHMLACKFHKANIEIEYLTRFKMDLPRTASFYNLDLNQEKAKDLEKVEKK